MENEYNYLPTMQAYLTTSTSSHTSKEFKFSSFLSSVLYTELVLDNGNTSILPFIPESLANVTTANNSRIVNCTNFVLMNQTDISVEVIYLITLILKKRYFSWVGFCVGGMLRRYDIESNLTYVCMQQ